MLTCLFVSDAHTSANIQSAYKQSNMRKILKIALPLLLLLVGLSACEGPAGRDGRDGHDGVDGWANAFTDFYEIEDWYAAPNNSYYYADIKCAELTNEVYDWGIINVYLMDYYDTDDEIQIPLPYNKYCGDEISNWTETISFEIIRKNNNIRIYYEPSDFIAAHPGKMAFKVAFMW